MERTFNGNHVSRVFEFRALMDLFSTQDTIQTLPGIASLCCTRLAWSGGRRTKCYITLEPEAGILGPLRGSYPVGVPGDAHPLRVARCASGLWFLARCALRVAQWSVITLRVAQPVVSEFWPDPGFSFGMVGVSVFG